MAFHVIPAIGYEAPICGDCLCPAVASFLSFDALYGTGEYPWMAAAGCLVLSFFQRDSKHSRIVQPSLSMCKKPQEG